jgi:integrase
VADLVRNPQKYFNPANFRKDVWEKAAKASGITDKVPYSMRHSFAAWALTLRIDPNRLVRLMGHGSKKMIYEVYGDYIEGLEEDFWQILAYFGRDFAQPKMKASSTMIEYQNGYTFPPSFPLQPSNYPQQNEAPNLPLKTFW